MNKPQINDFSLDTIQKLIFEVQEILFKKGTKEEAINACAAKNLPIETILICFVVDEEEKRVNLIIELINLLIKFKGFVTDLIHIIIEQAHQNEGNLIKIKSIPSKKYFLQIIKDNLSFFIQENFLKTLLKVNLMDDSAGIYTQALKLMIYAYTNQECKEYLIKENFIDNLIDYLNTVITSFDSIYLIRKLEIILGYFGVVNTDYTLKSGEELRKMCEDFSKYDMLTQLAFLETLEQDINNENILMLCEPNKNFFNESTSEFSENVLRKLLFTFSKFYARNFFTQEIKLLKNTLAISFQYYTSTKRSDFICPILLNIFNNKDIYSFLLDSANNAQFEFFNIINEIIIENYLKPDPHIKVDVLEIFAQIFTTQNENLTMQENYVNLLMRLIYKNNKGIEPKDDNEALVDFVEGMYNDFKKYDLPDYEIMFLECIHSMILNQKICKVVLSNFEFVLYLLNRREKPKEVLDKKYKIIDDIVKKTDLVQLMSKEFANQFINYVNKGPY